MTENNNSTKKNYQFFNPITQAGAGAGITPNFPLGAGNIDFHDFKKNIPHFEELAINFGLGRAKAAILKNTFNFFQTKPSPKRPQPQFPVEQSNNDEQPLTIVGTSIFGTPVFANLSIIGGSYQDNQQQTIGEYDDVRVDAVIFEVTRENNLVLTDIQGRDNSVIEYISKKSWNINCKGRILSTTRNNYPTTAVNNLRIALDSNKSLRVNSWFLSLFGIYNIVIKKKSVPQEEGGLEYQKFEFDAIADAPIILKRPK